MKFALLIFLLTLPLAGTTLSVANIFDNLDRNWRDFSYSNPIEMRDGESGSFARMDSDREDREREDGLSGPILHEHHHAEGDDEDGEFKGLVANPEPAGLVMIGLGLLVLGKLRRAKLWKH